MARSEFAAKWKGVRATERSAAQSHFMDLCRVLRAGTPMEMPLLS